MAFFPAAFSPGASWNQKDGNMIWYANVFLFLLSFVREEASLVLVLMPS